MSNKKNNERLYKILSSINKLVVHDYLFVDVDNSRMAIRDSLASIYLKDEQTFSNFIRNIELWMSYDRSCAQMEGYTTEELKEMEIPDLPEIEKIDICIVNSVGKPIVIGCYKDKNISLIPYDELYKQISEE